MIENFQSCILMLLAKVFGHLAAPNDDAWAEFVKILLFVSLQSLKML